MRIGRIGYLAKGVIFISVGLLSALAAVRGSTRATDSRRVMQTIVQQPFGHGLLLALIIGLVCYVLWCALAALVDAGNKGADAKGVALRARSLFVAGIYSGITVAAVKTFIGVRSSGGGGDRSAQDWTATALATPFGSWLVVVIGMGIIAAGVYQCWRAYTEKFEEKLDLSTLGGAARTNVVRVCAVGLAARGIIFVIAGVLLTQAGLQSNPARARGLIGALNSLHAQPFGRWLFAIVAAGLAAYGIYCCVVARYGKIAE